MHGRVIVVVGHTKGGVAKTSLALALAIQRASQGRDVLLVDADEQQTASKFAALRTSLEVGGASYQTAAYVGRAVRDQVRTLAPRFQDTVIDVGGRNTDSLRAALMVADRLVVPVPPASFEVWEVETIDELVGAAKTMNPKLDATSILSMADHRRGRNNAEAVAALRDAQHIGYSGVVIHSRVAWQEAQAAGRAVFEMPRPDAKATAEVNALTAAAFQ